MLARVALLLCLLSSCRSACRDAKMSLETAPDFPPYLAKVKSACPPDDPEAQALIQRTESADRERIAKQKEAAEVEQKARRERGNITSVKNGGVTTNGGVMVFRTAAEHAETVKCIRKFQRGNAEVEAQARLFENPARAIEELRALCMLAAVEKGTFLQVGNKVAVLEASDGALVKVKVLDGAASGGVFLAPREALE